MLRPRIIPVLLLRGESLVKTVQFDGFRYIGDPCNTLRIFNELEVDELFVLDISAPDERRGPRLSLLRDMASEAFMPLAYGGGIQAFDDAKRVFEAGFEKVVLNTAAVRTPDLLGKVAAVYGSQSVVVSIDARRSPSGAWSVVIDGGRTNTHKNPGAWAVEAVERGAGEILLTSVDREGTWEGFDLELVRSVSAKVSVPVVAHGGCGGVADIVEVLRVGGASAVAVGSLVVFQKRGMGVLVNMPRVDL